MHAFTGFHGKFRVGPETWNRDVSVEELLDPSNPLNAPAERRPSSPQFALLKIWPYHQLPSPISRVKL